MSSWLPLAVIASYVLVISLPTILLLSTMITRPGKSVALFAGIVIIVSSVAIAILISSYVSPNT